MWGSKALLIQQRCIYKRCGQCVKTGTVNSTRKMTLITKLILAGLLYSAIQHSVLGQEQNNVGQDTNPTLNENEAKLLNDYFSESRGTFDFQDKKVVFISGSTGNTYITKRDYFDDISKWNETNSRIATSLIILTEKEKKESGDYDAILTAWVKVFAPKRRTTIIKELGSTDK